MLYGNENQRLNLSTSSQQKFRHNKPLGKRETLAWTLRASLFIIIFLLLRYLLRVCRAINTWYSIRLSVYSTNQQKYGDLSVFLCYMTNPPQANPNICFSAYSRLYDSDKQTNKQEYIQLKAVVPPLNCRTMTLLFSFAPYNFFMMVSRNRTAP